MERAKAARSTHPASWMSIAADYLPPLRPTGLPSINFAIMYAAVIISTVSISSITYLFIEMPMIRLGSRLIESRRSLPTQTAQA